jgi:hypothetical protein
VTSAELLKDMVPTRPASAIDAAFEGFRESKPSDLSKVLLLSRLWGLLAELERDGELSERVVKQVVMAVGRAK